MCKHITFCFVLFSFLISTTHANAQTQGGQIIVSVGLGWSPEFNGKLSPLYPVGDNSNFFQNKLYFSCSSITPNISEMIDIGLSKKISIGIASSYQTEIVNWSTDFLGPFSDKITRTNFALRLFYNFPINPQFDIYVGVRVGASYWADISSSNNYVQVGHMASGYPIYGQFYFLNDNYISSFVPSFQILSGIRYYPFKNIGVYAEFGIGSPYLAEGGLTFRINTKKEKPTSDSANTPNK